jgi:hypothetical protein
LLPLPALARANVAIIRTTRGFLISVELFNSTFAREPGRSGVLDVEFAPLAHDPEKACPRRDRGWSLLFGMDHA